MPKISVRINCPECNLPIQASVVQEDYKDFLLYSCPRCQKNVVYYNNKVKIISDRILKKLISQKKLKYCGNLGVAPMEQGRGKGLTKESVTDLKILLETSKDINEFISKI